MDYKPRKQRDLVAERARANERTREKGRVMHEASLKHHEEYKQSQAKSLALKQAIERKQGYSQDLHTGSPYQYKLRHEMKKGLRPRPTREQALETFKNYSKN